MQLIFPAYNAKMRGLDWGALYDEFHEQTLDAAALQTEIDRLWLDDDVTNKKGIYYYVLTRKEKYLSLRQFSEAQKIEAYKKSKEGCAKCGKKFALDEMQADHITPWSKGGKTTSDNCQMLCADCNRKKSNK